MSLSAVTFGDRFCFSRNVQFRFGLSATFWFSGSDFKPLTHWLTSI